MEKRNLPVAVFDSGVGGISVLRELVRLMPCERFYFLGDSIHAPYGTRSVEEVRELTLTNIRHMADKGIKGIVVACNTATSAAIAALREIYTDIPVVGIEPALKPAVTGSGHARVLVLATPMTVRSEKFRSLLDRYRDQGDIIPVGCPGLMEFVEAGILSGPEPEQYLRALLAPCMREPVDAVVLGCTHYPFLKESIRRVLGEGPRIIDGSAGTARELQRRLREMDLLTDRNEPGSVEFEMTLPEKKSLCERLLCL